jgi:hypothetical protein
MTDPLVNVEGPQPGDRVQVEARGRVLETNVDRDGTPCALVQFDSDAIVGIWLPMAALVLLDPRATP